MKFFVENQEIEKELNEIMSLIRLRMNGATVDQMEKAGIVYRKNYGVSLEHLKAIAANLPKRYDLAERLWFMEIRETMLLAAMIVPHDKMSLVKAMEWCQKINNNDLVERSTMFLWGKLPFANELAKVCLSHHNKWSIALAYYIIGWYAQLIQSTDVRKLDDMLSYFHDTDDFIILKSFAFAIKKQLRVLKGGSPLLEEFLSKCADSELKNLQFIGQEIQNELDFVRDL
ncbi:DNA alkylation repair protein [Carboxylicivirga sp. N1Y90]|uniref:DNA alkylation repair protein n=1 Tax=Carboxylicivirga fragile TaxID=3417571 RepID=UPI003D341EFB|nr:DNA alkylation repair protein [Marinilabiliaceae bacterium N1Y90]